MDALLFVLVLGVIGIALGVIGIALGVDVAAAIAWLRRRWR
jgi:hypothetical protein